MSLAIPETFDALQSTEQVEILDTVDALRTCGLDGIISLPQLVVCGDQSSGKSSVLEAITEIPFPRKENLCTRFATEIVLRRSKVVRISAQIIPDQGRSQAEQEALRKQQLSLTNFSKLPDLIDKVTKIVGLDNGHKKSAFSRDVLRIVIEGPRRPALTLVDLPGLIHSENKSQTAEDVQVISALVEQYISNPRTIILAIVSAMNDAANQIILKRARDHDPNGQRTLGIITKPDTLIPGSENEDAFIGLAKNQDIMFARGWHVLRGRAFSERTVSFNQRNTIECEFFSQGRWLELDSDTVGVDALRMRLSELLFTHVKQELPRLRSEIETASTQTATLLGKLGQKRESLSEQRQFLTKISTMFRDICKAAVDGHYDHKYFDVKANGVLQHRLRALIQKLHIEYADVLRREGQTYRTVTKLATTSNPGATKMVTLGDKRVSVSQQDMSRPQMLEMVKSILVVSRGREMVGTYNPDFIGVLFRSQSKNWQRLAEQHISNVADACSRFCSDLLRNLGPKDNISGQLSRIVEDSLKARHHKAKDELENLIKDKSGPPQTYNHYLTLTVDKNRKRRIVDAKAPAQKRLKTDNEDPKSSGPTAALGKTIFGASMQGNFPVKLGSFAQNTVANGVPTQGNLPTFGSFLRSNSPNATPAQVNSPSGMVPRSQAQDGPTVTDDDLVMDDTSVDVNGCVMDMDEYSCLDALDYLNAYYKVILHLTSTSLSYEVYSTAIRTN